MLETLSTGTLEVTQDIDLQNITGEKRLLDER